MRRVSMNKLKENISYKQILDETNQLIQVSTIDGYEMMYANRPARMFTNHEEKPYEGQKCYQYMMGLDEQCPFCPMRELGDREFYETEIDNGNQVFTVKTQKLQWEGKEAFIEYATDITMIRRMQQIFESQMQMLLQSIPEAPGIFHFNLTDDQWISSNGISQNIESLRNPENTDKLIKMISDFIPDPKMKKEFWHKFQRASLMKAYKNGRTEVVMELLSYYDDNSIRWTKMSARLMMNPNTGKLECILYGLDISEERLYRDKIAIAEKENRKLEELTRRDRLTNIYSKQAFEELFYEYIEGPKKESFAVVFIDLDNFKDVNDTLGHLKGDEVIKDTANHLQTSFLNKDVVSRFGGDEFCVLVKDISEEVLKNKMEFVRKKLSNTYYSADKKVEVSASQGAIFCEKPVDDLTLLMHKADQALYQAKNLGRNQFCIKYIRK